VICRPQTLFQSAPFRSPNSRSFSTLIDLARNFTGYRSMLQIHLKHYAQTLERETGIEPATNSLEGCDSTTELLPPS
jgi:hypothetical protein